MYIEGASLNAPHHDLLMFWINVLTIGAFLLVNAVLVYFIIVYRRRGPNDRTSSIAHSTTVEIIWTVIPSIVFVVLYVWGLVGFINMRTAPDDAMIISVSGKQWAWEYTYPAELRTDADKATLIKTYNTLYLEEGQAVKLVMKSQDVLHSFFIPAFRVKEDVTPNIFTYVTFTPLIKEGGIKLAKAVISEEGDKADKTDKEHARYDIFCTEYCGKDHSYMIGHAVVMAPEDFRAKIASIEAEAGDISVEKGEKIYQGNCVSCHSVDGSRIVGPSFQGVYGTNRPMADGTSVEADENYIRSSILNPNEQIVEGYPAAMPVQNLSDSEIQSVIEYMKTL
ncbi:MAG: c-type cytochrome [bacterium]|nr:c-type cytochrome [bacterium]